MAALGFTECHQEFTCKLDIATLTLEQRSLASTSDLPADAADASPDGKEPVKLATADLQAAGTVKRLENEGYLDATAKSPSSPAPEINGASVDDQIRAKKAVDRQTQKDFMMDDIKRSNPKGSAKDWDSRADEKLKAAGW